MIRTKYRLARSFIYGCSRALSRGRLPKQFDG